LLADKQTVATDPSRTMTQHNSELTQQDVDSISFVDFEHVQLKAAPASVDRPGSSPDSIGASDSISGIGGGGNTLDPGLAEADLGLMPFFQSVPSGRAGVAAGESLPLQEQPALAQHQRGHMSESTGNETVQDVARDGTALLTTLATHTSQGTPAQSAPAVAQASQLSAANDARWATAQTFATHNAAQALQHTLRSQLDLAVATETFGRVTIQTQHEGRQVSAQLDVENATQTSLLAEHLPETAERIRQHAGWDVSLHLEGSNTGEGSSSQQQRQSSEPQTSRLRRVAGVPALLSTQPTVLPSLLDGRGRISLTA
jgi:hypothetical protein